MPAIETLSDKKIIEYIRAGDKESASYLVEKYTKFVEKIAKKYYIPGQEYEDILQEGLIGFFEAVKGYDTDSKLPFKNFAYYCIQKNIFDAIQTASRKKRQPLHRTISLELEIFEKEEKERKIRVIDQIVNQGDINPEDVVIVRSLVEEVVSLLSKFEKKILKEYLEGKCYEEIAIEVNRPPKAVGNALQRIRKKIKDYFVKEVKRE